jgi:hypothetical protein
MIGTKKLTEIRIEILKSLGKDPIGRLDRIIAKAQDAGESDRTYGGLEAVLATGANTQGGKANRQPQAKGRGRGDRQGIGAVCSQGPKSNRRQTTGFGEEIARLERSVDERSSLRTSWLRALAQVVGRTSQKMRPVPCSTGDSIAWAARTDDGRIPA